MLERVYLHLTYVAYQHIQRAGLHDAKSRQASGKRDVQPLVLLLAMYAASITTDAAGKGERPSQARSRHVAVAPSTQDTSNNLQQQQHEYTWL